MYIKLYPETLQSSASVEALVQGVWEMVGGGKRPGVADDQVRDLLTCTRRVYQTVMIACLPIPALHLHCDQIWLLQTAVCFEGDYFWPRSGRRCP